MDYKLQEKGSIYFNENAWNALSLLINNLKPTKVFLIVDQNTKKDCLPYFRIKSPLQNKFEVLEIKEGEKHKNIDSCIRLWELLSNLGADRHSVVINLGGGVVTDMGGFVAATYKRGMAVINIPTSLLGMVDAAIGGKNGIDFQGIKNQIGTINDPKMIIIDPYFLKTLPEEEIRSGYAEMLKHGLIYSEDYWHELKSFDILASDNTEKLIRNSLEIKADVVSQDPNESGTRKILNYGHTLGHAIEAYSHQKNSVNPLLHGDAIAIGMILATFISSEMMGFPRNKMEEISKVILGIYRKVNFSNSDIENIIELMKYDKKNRNGMAHFVLLSAIGYAKTDCIVSNDLIFSAFNFYKNF